MDWLKSILNNLPLEQISNILGEIIIWWSQIVSGISPDNLPTYAYLGGAVIVLLLWVLVARMLPRPFGGMSWMILFAVLLAPGTALNDPSTLAPASISVVYAVMMKDMAGAISNALPILVVLVVGLFIGFVWQLIRGAFESSLDKAREHTAADTTANMQLAGGNYLAKGTLATEAPVAGETRPPFTMLKKNADEKKASEIISQPAITSPVITSSNGTPANDSFANDVSVANDVTKTSTTVKIDVEPKRKPIEGFYSKKLIKEPVVITDKDSKDKS